MKQRRHYDVAGDSQNRADPTTRTEDDELTPRSSTTTITTTIDEGRKRRSSPTTTTSSSSSMSIVRDNPCWGSPTECSLAHLLTILDKTTTILHKDASYVAINKPPDLRMDGDYEATVLKLLAFWYPPRSLLVNSKNDHSSTSSRDNGKMEVQGDDNVGNDNGAQNQDKLLLQRVANFIHHGQRHPDLDDGCLLRPCHQLDYATSGVLLCARSRTAANHVRVALEERRVSKTYLALLHGHVKVTADWPPVLKVVSYSSSSTTSSPLDEVRRRLHVQEDAYRRARDKMGQNKSHTFLGYRPASSLFQQWKHALQKKEQQQQQDPPSETDKQPQNHHQHQPQPKKSKWSAPKNNSDKINNKKQPQLLDDEWTLVWNELHCSNDDNDSMSELIKTAASLKWSQVREMQQDFRFERAAKKFNEILANRQKQQQPEQKEEGVQDDDITLPVVFCMPGDDNDTTFYICAPLAQHTDDFDMRLPANLAYSSLPEHLNVGNTDSDSSDLDFKPCLTKCTIKRHCHVAVPTNKHDNNDEEGNNNSTNDNNKSEKKERCSFYPVTKVEFSLMTGRRHQLRVHSALIGHSIVGDETYQDDIVPKNLSDRMCLHSHSLEVPLPWDDSSRPISSSTPSCSSSNDKNDAGIDQNILRVQAPDPFVETEDGCIEICML
jgi:23S rRNA-/tRNA-specific pseudouridylate synthase